MKYRNRTRDDLRQDILSGLGHPIIQVNLTRAMLDSAINQAIKQLWVWHYDFTFQTQYLVTLTEQDINNNYIQVPENIDSVVEVLAGGWRFGDFAFTDPEWQLARQMFIQGNRFYPMSLADYTATMERLYNTEHVLGRHNRPFSFSKHQHIVQLQFPHEVGEVIAMRVYQNVDPEDDNPDMYEVSTFFDNETLKALATAYAKQTWGAILSKFQGIQLPGGIVLDGQQIKQEGNDDADKILDYLHNMNPVGDFFMG
ncbi:hypothetical protein [Ralstonia phage RSP15]|uniref:hypothetical protein n=1 Tax=Ralstonia phage RSP15 TaxID=1785960 RepID=UPI00074D4C4A|nr:hypothetical protein BH754_gp042 [Ralstonia phage RSP15]BAU40000.1 hypothetical protein [Ralstonia phage RSP15]